MRRSFVSIAAVFSFALAEMPAFSQNIEGQNTKGRVLEPSEHNLALTWRAAHVALPAGYAGQDLWQGRAEEMPTIAKTDQPLAIFMHGSSGLAPFVKEYQLWLASSLGLASIAPDSLAIPERLTYISPIAKDIYERVHSLRHAELGYALERAKHFTWVDSKRIAIIGTSEGAVAIARLSDPLPAARIIYAWPCEANYFVAAPQNAVPIDRPVLAIAATRDPYFSAENPWNAGYAITGSCALALKGHKDATIVSIASDKHTIVALPAARDTAAAFLKRTLGL